MEVSSTSSVSSSSVRRGRRHSWPPNSSLAEEESDDNGGEKSPNVAAESVPSAAAKGVTRKFSYMVAVSSGQEQLVTSHDSGFAVNSSASGGIVDRLGTFENAPPPSSKAPRKSPILEDAGSSGAQSAGGHSVASARSARSTRSTKSQQAQQQRKRRIASIFQHYYPEGGWGYVVLACGVAVQAVAHGAQLSFGVLALAVRQRWRMEEEGDFVKIVWLGSFCHSSSLLLSPLTVAFCKRKSTRLSAVIGGLLLALGCLFTSFATEFHQLFLCYGVMMGMGVGLTRDTSTLMLGQYFKKRRERVEVALVAASGVGMVAMCAMIHFVMRHLGWVLGLEVITMILLTTCFLGTFYRSASLYHPQRRAILHLKSQKRKIKNKDKEKNKAQDDRPPYFDFATLRSRTVQLLLLSVSISSLGQSSPIFFLGYHASLHQLGTQSIVMLYTYMGTAWILGCLVFGSIVTNHSKECQISRQYLCQASLAIVGISIFSITSVTGYNGYVSFALVYGFFQGGHCYSLKMYVYYKVRARNFARTWSFTQFCMGLPSLIGIPLTGYISCAFNSPNSGFYFSAVCTLAGSLAISLIDVHLKRLRRKKRARKLHNLSKKSRASSTGGHSGSTDQTSLHGIPDFVNLRGEGSSGLSRAERQAILASLVGAGRNSSGSGHHHDFENRILSGSYGDQKDILIPAALLCSSTSGSSGSGSQHRSFTLDDLMDLKNHQQQQNEQCGELSIYSEEGIADMDLPDNFFLEELEMLDNITSCAKVENCLMLSEYEQNLIKETESPLTNRRRKWSFLRQSSSGAVNAGGGGGGGGGGGSEAAADSAAHHDPQGQDKVHPSPRRSFLHGGAGWRRR